VLYGVAAHVVPVDDGFRVDLAAMAARAARSRAGIVLANPDAPTGMGWPLRTPSGGGRARSRRVVDGEALPQPADGRA